MSLHLAAVFAANFVFIGLKAFQQLNVVHGDRKLVLASSISLAAAEVYVIATIASSGWDWPLVLALGLGGGCGCLFSMWARKRFVK